MVFLRVYEVEFIFSLVVFLNVGTFGVRDSSILVEAATWGEWGSWTRCNALNYARQTRFRSCLDSRGEAQRSSNCDGHARRTRQCKNCQYPLLTSSDTTSLYTIVNSPGFQETSDKKAWCTSQSTGNDYLEIKFTTFVRFTAIGTVGYSTGSDTGHVSEYKLQYSYNGNDWFMYKSGEKERVFYGGDKSRRTETLPLVAQYLRVYPVKYQWRACMNVQLYGCEYNCGGLITNDLIHVRSPNAAKLVEEPNCLWRIELPDAFKLQILFSYLKLLCKDGFLQLADGATPFIGEFLFEEICGPSHTISPLVFRGNQLWLHYRANATTDDIGFRLRVNVYGTATLNSSAGDVRAPEHEHEHKHAIRYTWFINSLPNMTIALTIHQFESNNIILENGECLGDLLVVHNQTGIENLLPERFCNEKLLPKVFTSTSGYLRIKYKAGANKPKWKLHFSYRVSVSGAGDGSRIEREDILRVPSARPENKSRADNDTQLEIDAVVKPKTGGGESNVAAIISSILAVVIVLVLLVALLHFLRKRKQFLKKHPYDCSTRPMSHFGEEDSTPFINQNVLMWSDSNPRKNDKEKPKKNSLPHITVALRDESPQRLSIIPAEALTSTTEVPPESEPDEEKPISLVVSDAFTQECLQLLGNSLIISSDFKNNEECETDAQNEHEDPAVENKRFSENSTNSYQDMASASSLENFADCVSPAAVQIARGIPLTSPEIVQYLRHDAN